ncbi:hypothetical protein G7Y89_g13171 [Cudoniella acicularis]|uniref:Uncharacterized protein n=1 Tax=Cudoniella acicularis TaxID=354080 RepID=A0A8H4R8S1_9HELO|nr:hypothetical protein G7Y89_g13171 [Cudoniella acicularis]
MIQLTHQRAQDSGLSSDKVIKSPDRTVSYQNNVDNAIGWLGQLNVTPVPWDTWALGANSGFARARKSMMLGTISNMLGLDKEKRITSEGLSQLIGKHDCCDQPQEPFAIEDEQIRDNPATPPAFHLKHDVSWFDTSDIRPFVEILIIGCLRSDFSDFDLMGRVISYAICVKKFLGRFPHTKILFQRL